MKSERNRKISEALKKTWKTKRNKMMQNRTPEMYKKQGENIKKHFIEHPEHKIAISKAQTKRWRKINNALTICKKLGIDLDY